MADLNISEQRFHLEEAAAGHPPITDGSEQLMVPVGREGRGLYLYEAKQGYELQEELDYLANRSIETNVFFTGRFLAPAMLRLEDRAVRLAILRDTANGRNRARLLIPFSIDKPGFSIGASIIRTWANPFGPLGTPLVDAEFAGESVDNFLEALANPEANLPSILVIPDIRLRGQVAQLIRTVAMSRNLAVVEAEPLQRPMLESLLDGETYLSETISPKHVHDLSRQWRRLSEKGELTYQVARQPQDIRERMEEFLALEASGWKGRERSALTTDRYHAAFAREAINNLAEKDNARIHTIDLNGKAIAAMVVFVISGEAYTWKTAYDEAYAEFSPGKLLLRKITEWNLDDANIVRTDSCAVPDHPLMSRFWRERADMGSLVIGLKPNSDRDARQAAAQLHLYRNTRNMAKSIRNRIMAMRKK